MKSIIDQDPGACLLCGSTWNLEEHHIFCGKNRKLSEKYGLKIRLCPYCHRDGKAGVHADAKKAEQLHRMGQQAFERRFPEKNFREIFGKNYL